MSIKKKYYIALLISTTIQTKYILAENKEEAKNLADEYDWDEKEEVLDNEIKIKTAKKSDATGRYILTSNGELKPNN